MALCAKMIEFFFFFINYFDKTNLSKEEIIGYDSSCPWLHSRRGKRGELVKEFIKSVQWFRRERVTNKLTFHSIYLQYQLGCIAIAVGSNQLNNTTML